MTTNLADVCADCGQPWDDHALRDYRAHWAATHPALPFEPAADGQPFRSAPLSDFADGVTLSTGVVILPEEAIAVVGVRALGVLHFDFLAGGTSLYSQQVVLSDEQLREFRTLVSAAVDQALKSVRRRR